MSPRGINDAMSAPNRDMSDPSGLWAVVMALVGAAVIVVPAFLLGRLGK